ncbi:RNA polymerase sigma-70 factor, ECF subfamily [Ekhidna lutea]|uniref:RNA polymerase sigma-70 factor, ECF subfamily n=1 Tax=Ekhidna lutea TaxID=447679 RepID=A0A239KCB0_EKHLU|nr:sigma-70 family RNA polymerase sigma factor [Ekhidna lutea]SNT15303.1 RNA polymerase sigma-70 factor, ECF subfamily [Ekhidna lutea]
MLRINKSLTEEELLEGCRKGKASAQRGLYDRLAPKMLGVCLRYIKDREEAEHIMIGGIVKVFEKLDQFKSEGSFEGWVRRIIVNDCLMYIRKNRNMSLETDIDNVSDSPNLSVMEDSLDKADLLKLISELPVGYRTVFNLYAIEGYSHAEIAKQLDINENTSKSQLSRARKWLQARLIEMEKEIENTYTNGSSKH